MAGQIVFDGCVSFAEASRTMNAGAVITNQETKLKIGHVFADENITSDYISEGLMRSVIHSSRIANKDPQNYEARSNLMWTATWALNTLVAKGKSTDWMVHMLGQGGRRRELRCLD